MNRVYFNNEVDLCVNPKTMNYLETITQISKHNHINLKEAVKKYYDLTGVPSEHYYNFIMTKDDLLPFGCHVKLTANMDVLSEWGIPLELVNCTLTIGAINVIADEHDETMVSYRIIERPYLEFSRDTLVKLKE